MKLFLCSFRTSVLLPHFMVTAMGPRFERVLWGKGARTFHLAGHIPSV